MLSALKNRNLQLYFGGQVISQVGTWMEQMALSWLVYRLTGSVLALGTIGFVSQIPSMVLSPVAGIVADRMKRHHLILITQTAAMIQAAVLTALVWTGHEQMWQLMVLAAVLGMVMAFDIPTRQAFMADMLDDPNEMAAAVGLNSSITTITRLIGPFIAGVAVAAVGEKACFLINAVSYLAVIVALLFVKSNQKERKATKQSAFEQIKEGFEYTLASVPIRNMISLLALIGFVVMPVTVLMPAFAKDVFGGNAMTLGWLTGASATGSTIGALFLASQKGTKLLSRWIAFGSVLCGVGLVALGLSRNLIVSLLAVAFVGLGTMLVMAGSMTLIQTIVDPDKRGRVMSLVVMAFMGTSPFGSIIAGALAAKIGVGFTTIITGTITVVVAGLFANRILNMHAEVSRTQALEAVTELEEELAVVA